MTQWVKNPPAVRPRGDVGSTSGSGRFPGEGNGNPLQYSCLENPWTEASGRHQEWGHKEWATTEWLSMHTEFRRERRLMEGKTVRMTPLALSVPFPKPRDPARLPGKCPMENKMGLQR